MAEQPDKDRAELGARVLAARGRSVIEPPPEAHAAAARPWSLRWSAVLLIALGGIVFMVALGRSSPSASGGALEATTRLTQPLGPRAGAVLEPGAAIQWVLEPGGETLVWQPRGEVFYRTDRGRRFRVETPAARLDALGTSFRVTAAGPRLTVHVDEGRVRVTANDGTVRDATPGAPVELPLPELVR